MNIVTIIEARMTSSRLPGKVLLKALEIPLLEHLVNRVKKVELISKIIIATTINSIDDKLVEFAIKNNIEYYRGSEEDVMLRVLGAAELFNADVIVEITGDCPIIDPMIIEQVIETYLKNSVDYVSNANIRSYPDGMDVQVFSYESLSKSISLTSDLLDHEHVTLHIRKNPQIFRQINLIAPKDVYWPDLGLTLDEEDDYLLIKKIIEYFGVNNAYFTCLEVVNLLKNNPSFLSINKNVVRKGDS